jgi:hypothetical protein
MTSSRGNALVRASLAGVQAALAELPSLVRTRTFFGADSAYLTRTNFPRVLGVQPLLHRIWRADEDPDPHNHPWLYATFLVVSGGYTDERRLQNFTGEWRTERTLLRPGDLNKLENTTFHRAVDVLPNTCTIGLTGPIVQDWGFLVDGKVIPNRDYLRSKGRI